MKLVLRDIAVEFTAGGLPFVEGVDADGYRYHQWLDPLDPLSTRPDLTTVFKNPPPGDTGRTIYLDASRGRGAEAARQFREAVPGLIDAARQRHAAHVAAEAKAAAARARARRIAEHAEELLAALRLMLRGTAADCSTVRVPSDAAVRAAFAAIEAATGEKP